MVGQSLGQTIDERMVWLRFEIVQECLLELANRQASREGLKRPRK